MQEAEIPEVDVSTAQEWINQTNVKIVDIRAQVDFEQGNIDGAVHIKPATFDDFLASTDKNQKILCYCYFGNSSLSFCAALIDQGYTDVASLKGGFNAWSQV